MKHFVLLLAAAFMLSPVGLAIAGAGETSAAAPDRGEQASATQGADGSHRQIMVYYFHGNKRCKTCRTIEAYAEEALESRFSKELDSGLLEWKVVNFDEAQNKHYLEDFGLYSSSVVVVESDGEKIVRHEILPEVWSLVREKQSFFAYLNTAVRKYLE